MRPPQRHTPHAEAREPSLFEGSSNDHVSRLRRPLPRSWRIFGYCLLAVAAAGLATILLAPDLAGLYLFGLYSAPSNSIVPIPHEPGLFFVARYYDPFWVAVAGTSGTCLSAFLDYAVLIRLFERDIFSRAKESRLFEGTLRWFMRRPFATVVVFAATPLPVALVRVLAPAAKYSAARYVAAMAVGRFPRYWFMAWIGQAVGFPNWLLVAMFVVLLVIGWRSFHTTRRKPA